MFIGNGNNHTICSSALTAAESGCSGVNESYDGGIVAMAAGGLLFAVGMITYRPDTTKKANGKSRAAQIRGNRVLAGIAGTVIFVAVVVLVLSLIGG